MIRREGVHSGRRPAPRRQPALAPGRAALPALGPTQVASTLPSPINQNHGVNSSSQANRTRAKTKATSRALTSRTLSERGTVLEISHINHTKTGKIFTIATQDTSARKRVKASIRDTPPITTKGNKSSASARSKSASTKSTNETSTPAPSKEREKKSKKDAGGSKRSDSEGAKNTHDREEQRKRSIVNGTNNKRQGTGTLTVKLTKRKSEPMSNGGKQSRREHKKQEKKAWSAGGHRVKKTKRTSSQHTWFLVSQQLVPSCLA
jgi:hypothetical protein